MQWVINKCYANPGDQCKFHEFQTWNFQN